MSRAGILLSLALLSGCSSVKGKVGVDEPVKCRYPALDGTRDAQFHAGAIPAANGGPDIVAPQTQNTLVPQGALGRKFTGNAKPGARAIAFRLNDVGNGYWIVPVGAEDPSTEHELSWELTCDFGGKVPAGKHAMQFAAAREDGAFGEISEIPIVVQSRIPGGKVVLTLEWDTDADLDLHLISVQTGKQLDPKHPSTATSSDAGVDPAQPNIGVLDRDSNAACVLDNYRQEDIVWKDGFVPGQYIINVNMFAACGAGGTNFKVTLRVDGEERLVRVGRLLDIDANGGAGPGLFVTTITL